MEQIPKIEKHNLIDSIPLGVFILRRDCTVRQWNSVLEVWTGIDRSQIVDRDIGEFFPHLLQAQYQQRLKGTFDSGLPALFSANLHRSIIPALLPNGNPRIQNTLVTSIPAEDGSRWDAVFSIQDVTDLTMRTQQYRRARDQANRELGERERAEEELRESEERFKATFNNSPSIIHLRDLDGRYKMVNSSFEKLLQVTHADVIGKTANDLFPRDRAELFTDQDDKVLNSGQSISREIKIPMPDGSVRQFISLKFPVLGSGGKVIGIGTMDTDLTEQKNIELQLRKSQKFEAIGQLAGGIAHEFNNMLQIIINGIQIARDKFHEPQLAKKYLDTALKSADRSAELTKQLLAYSCKFDLAPTQIDLNEMIAYTMKMVRLIIGEEIELEVNQSENIFTVEADADMLQQTLINLCVNSRDAMPDGGRLIVETRNHHADQEYCDINGWRQSGDYALISVSDNGVGMSSEIREHIFEPFYTTKEIGKGTGLGLAMVHGIVQQHDGVIEVFSEPGVGSTFNIYLPKSISQEAIRAIPVVGDSPGGSETILVAEDEEELLNMLSQTLKSKGYRVLAAKNGEEAMSVFKANADRIGLVILDIIMPKMGGRNVYEQIRKSGSNVPVLFSTGYSPDSSDAKFASESGLRTIHKPYSSEVLFKAVREVLDQ